MFKTICKWLDDNEVKYETIHHEPTPTSEDSARIRGDSLSQGAKAIIYKIQDDYALFVFAADRKMDTKKIKAYFKQKGKRVKKTRFASPDELKAMTGLVPGSVPPFGRPILDFDLYVDPSLMDNETISFNAGSLTDSIRLSLKDYINSGKPYVFDFVF